MINYTKYPLSRNRMKIFNKIAGEQEIATVNTEVVTVEQPVVAPIAAEATDESVTNDELTEGGNVDDTESN